MNPRLIRVVTSHFTQLQGLRTAAYGLALLLFRVANALPTGDVFDAVVRVAAWLLPFAFLAWANQAIPRFYARRYGRVVQSSPWDRPDTRFVVWLLAAVVLLAAHTSSSFLWAVWAGYPLYVAFSAWPYRLQHLLTAAAAVYAATHQLAHASQAARGEPGFDASVIAAAMIVAGLVDHLVLTRALSSIDAQQFAGSEDPAYDE